MNKSTTFLRIILLPVTLICAFVGLHCSAQDFLQKYPVLKKSDLKPFFEDWKVYSDSIAKIPQNYDPEIARVFMENQPEKSATTRYTVVPEKNRNSQCTGKEIWYVKQRDEFVRIPEPKGKWIE